jgi:hypothetical protein
VSVSLGSGGLRTAAPVTHVLCLLVVFGGIVVTGNCCTLGTNKTSGNKRSVNQTPSQRKIITVAPWNRPFQLKVNRCKIMRLPHSLFIRPLKNKTKECKTTINKQTGPLLRALALDPSPLLPRARPARASSLSFLCTHCILALRPRTNLALRLHSILVRPATAIIALRVTRTPTVLPGVPCL